MSHYTVTYVTSSTRTRITGGTFASSEKEAQQQAEILTQRVGLKGGHTEVARY